MFAAISLQAQVYEKNDFVLSLGVQRINVEKYSMNFIPVEFSADYMLVNLVKDKLMGSLGVLGQYYSYNEPETDTSFYVVNPAVSLGVHYSISDKFVAYAVYSAGYDFVNAKKDKFLPSDMESSFNSDLLIGGKYFFTPRFGIFMSHYLAKLSFLGGVTVKF